MKYGESIFDILYLLTALVSGLLILAKRRDSAGKLMGSAVLLLGAGDAFHLIPRVLNYFVEADFTIALGMGKLVTSVTMTIFYLLLYVLHVKVYEQPRDKKAFKSVILLVILRIAICILPWNGWRDNDSPLTWAIARNIPFAALGIIIIIVFYMHRKEIKELSRIWLYALLSFVFYMPVAIGAGIVPMLGMLMIPKTICYVLMIIAFVRYAFKGERTVIKQNV